MDHEANEGIGSVMAICLEFTSMASADEDDAIIKKFLQWTTKDYKGLSKKILEEFKEYVAKINHETFLDIIEH